jgi:hypothetical protein
MQSSVQVDHRNSILACKYHPHNKVDPRPRQLPPSEASDGSGPGEGGQDGATTHTPSCHACSAPRCSMSSGSLSMGRSVAKGPTTQPSVPSATPPPVRSATQIHGGHCCSSQAQFLHGHQAPHRTCFHWEIQCQTLSPHT